jgi:hypothetical protein
VLYLLFYNVDNKVSVLHLCPIIVSTPIESLPLDSGRTLVFAEYGYPKGSPAPTVKEEIRRYSSQYSARLSAHPNDLIVNLIELPDNRRL